MCNKPTASLAAGERPPRSCPPRSVSTRRTPLWNRHRHPVKARSSRATASVISSGSVSHSRVDPSTSASSSVTVPVGSSLTPRSLQFTVSTRGSGPLMLASMWPSEVANIRGSTETSPLTYVCQPIGYSRFLLPSQRRNPTTLPAISCGFPAIRSARPKLGGHQSAGQRDVSGPLAWQRVGHRSGLQVWQAQPVHLGVHVEQLASSAPPAARAPPWTGRTTAARRSGTGTETEPPAAPSNVSTSGSIRSATVSVAWGGWPAPDWVSPPPAARPRCAGSPPRCPGRRPARRNGPSADQARDPLGVERRRAHGLELVASSARPRRRAAPRAAEPAAPARRDCRSRPARARAARRRSPVRHTEYLCDSKGFQRQRGVVQGAQSGPDDATSTGAARSSAMSRSVTPSAPSSTSRPPAPSTRVSRGHGRPRRTDAPARCGWAAAVRPAARRPRRAPAARDSATTRAAR